jgi:SAM-dependent methyltransferase
MNEVNAETGYLLDNAAADAGGRFGVLSALFDPVTAGHVDALGIRPGWRCWEVGAGGLSVPRLLRDRVGSSGYVLATDVDVQWMNADSVGGMEVRQHDVAIDDPPGDDFDLVHARLVLVHLADRKAALRRMVAAVRPGGWLLIEDFDTALQPKACLDPQRPEEHLANHIRAGFLILLGERGADLRYGRRLPRLVREAGLTEVTAHAYFPVVRPGVVALEVANLNQVRGALVAHGLATEAEIQEYLDVLATGQLDLVTPPLISVRGRRS